MATRQRILDAAESEFGRLGYDQVHVARIVRRAGVAQGTFYVYFRSKKNLLQRLVPQLGERVGRVLSSTGDPAKTPAEMVALRWQAYVNVIEASPTISRIVSAAMDVDKNLTRQYYEAIALGLFGSVGRGINPDSILELVSSRQIGHDAQGHAVPEPVAEEGPESYDVWSPLEVHGDSQSTA